MAAIINCPACDGTGKGYRFNARGECVQRMTGAALGSFRPYCRDCAGAGVLIACETCDGTGHNGACGDCGGKGGREGDVLELEAHGVYQCVDCGFRAVPPYFVAGDTDEPYCVLHIVAARKAVARLEAMR